MEYVLEMMDVHKSFKGHQVLQGVNLQVPQKSIFGFLGNNGEGKSTAIRIFLGLLQADKGAINVFGESIHKKKLKALQKIGCIVDAPCAYSNLNADEFLKIACIAKKLSYSEIPKVLEQVNLKQDKRRLISQYSLGMKQRLAIANALLGSPKLLILDEPSNGLDPEGILDIRNLIKRLPEENNCTIFVSSHQLDEVEKMATHCALLRQGKVRFQAPIQELLQQKKGRLKLYVNDSTQAFQLLKNQNFICEIHSETQLSVHDFAIEHAAQVNAYLVQAGIQLFQAIHQQSSLEEWFFSSQEGVSP
jgi:ABC-type multidrug transport system ATPase subunit